MLYPTLNKERALWRAGYQFVVGLDEAGMGPLAGPVTAAAVSLPPDFSLRDRRYKLVRDSKTLSHAQREFLFRSLTADPRIKFAVSHISPAIIDRINIRNAAHRAMRQCVTKLLTADHNNDKTPAFLLLDGTGTLKDIAISQTAIVKGDAKVFSIAAASIIAKVSRDRIMRRLDKRYPQYQFAQHKGYGTKVHYAALAAHGPSSVHRTTYLR